MAPPAWSGMEYLTHWSLVTHVYVSELAQVMVQRQTITRTNADLPLIGPLGTNFSNIWIKT